MFVVRILFIFCCLELITWLFVFVLVVLYDLFVCWLLGLFYFVRLMFCLCDLFSIIVISVIPLFVGLICLLLNFVVWFLTMWLVGVCCVVVCWRLCLCVSFVFLFVHNSVVCTFVLCDVAWVVLFIWLVLVFSLGTLFWIDWAILFACPYVCCLMLRLYLYLECFCWVFMCWFVCLFAACIVCLYDCLFGCFAVLWCVLLVALFSLLFDYC